LDRVFLDANVLFAVGYREAAGLLRLWELPGVQLITSAYAIEEARRNLETAAQRVRLIERTTALEQVAELPDDTLIATSAGLPPKDIPILAAAIAGKATHLLTGDSRHFRALFNVAVGGVLVMRTADYLRMKLTPPEAGGGKS
jgi:uncharacterized protein